MPSIWTPSSGTCCWSACCRASRSSPRGSCGGGRRPGTARFDYDLAGTTVFQLLAIDVRQVAAGAWRPRLLVNLGLAALLLTPYTRVLASMVYFALVERDRKYVAFTAFVLFTLTYSLFLR
jgi:hypothetical protein